MLKAYQALMTILAQATDKQLAKYVQFLKAENEILRARLPQRIVVTPAERRRLMKLGRPLGAALKNLITIVKPNTFARWVRAASKPMPAKRVGRPRVLQSIRELVVQLARDNGWGYTRVLGELRKLTSRKVSRQTVVNILKEHGLDPGPKRGEKTWYEFLKIHAHALWQCDFVSKRIWTPKGLRDCFVLIFLHVASPGWHRQLVVGVAKQFEAFCRVSLPIGCAFN